jgi:lysophospholipase L1-like esterase
MKKRRSLLPRILILTVSLLVVAEIVSRIIGAPILPPNSDFIEAQEWRYADWIDRDPEVFWEYRPSQVIDNNFMKAGRYTINNRGYRGLDFKSEKPAGVTRILCFGESSTFGLGVSDADTWPRQMENKLNQLDPQKRRWEVLNLGVTNYSTLQGIRLARTELPRLDPDIVLTCFSWADHQPSANGVPDDRVYVGAGLSVSLVNLLSRSAAYRSLKAAVATLFPPEAASYAIPGFDQRRVPSTDYAENIERLMREATIHGARAVTVTSPISWPPPGMTDTSGVFHVHHRYRRLARFGAIAGGGEFVELANAFDQHSRFYDNTREENELFNAQGHAFAGEFLARYLLGDSVIVARYGSQMYTEGR